MGKGKEIIEINLEKRALSLKEINEILENDVKNLKLEIRDMKKEIKFLKAQVEINNNNEKNLKKEVDLLKNLITNISINQVTIQNKLPIINNINSKIINNIEELNFIENRLKYMEQFKNKNLTYNLIYRGTKDGELASDFHRKVDGKDKTITIIETTKGMKFGGYIDRKWDSYSLWITDDEKCFVFSLSLYKIYNAVKGEDKYQLFEECGPNFAVFGLEDNLFEKSSLNIVNKFNANKRFSGFTSDYELTGGDKEFQVKELEVFQIEGK